IIKGDWTPKTSIRKVIEEVTNTIDKPNQNHCVFTAAATLLDSNKAEYERKALESYNKICLPR
ncbi:unnamed protein product, partial [Adineta steineri]